MPSTQLISSAMQEETNEVLLTILSIKIDGTVVLRFVNDKIDIESNGEKFTACGFSAVLPDQSEGGNKTCKLQIDNTDVSIYKTIKQSLHGNKEITATVGVILSSSPDVYEQGPFDFTLRNISVTVESISGELYDSYMADKKITILTYNQNDFPGMFF